MTYRRPNPVLERAFNHKDKKPFAPMPKETKTKVVDSRVNRLEGYKDKNDIAPMTLEGTVQKTGLLLSLLIFSAGALYVGPQSIIKIVISLLPLLVISTIAIAFTVAYKPFLASKLAIIYAIIEGLLLGSISKLIEDSYSGISSQALMLTFGVAAAMLMLYRSGRIKVTHNFRIAVISATLGVGLVYLVSFIGQFIGFNVPFIHDNTIAGILISTFIVGLAAANLALDFDFIERGVSNKLPIEYEWVGAFGLVVTLAWLYIEILRLLSKLRSRG